MNKINLKNWKINKNFGLTTNAIIIIITTVFVAESLVNASFGL